MNLHLLTGFGLRKLARFCKNVKIVLTCEDGGDFAADVVGEEGVGEADLLGRAVDEAGVDEFAERGVERRGDGEAMVLPIALVTERRERC